MLLKCYKILYSTLVIVLNTECFNPLTWHSGNKLRVWHVKVFMKFILLLQNFSRIKHFWKVGLKYIQWTLNHCDTSGCFKIVSKEKISHWFSFRHIFDYTLVRLSGNFTSDKLFLFGFCVFWFEWNSMLLDFSGLKHVFVWKANNT